MALITGFLRIITNLIGLLSRRHPVYGLLIMGLSISPLLASAQTSTGPGDGAAPFGLTSAGGYWGEGFFSPFPPEVTNLVITPEGHLVVAGPFSQIEDVFADRLAIRHGDEWSDMDGGVPLLSGFVGHLAASPDGSVYVGGSFDKVGNTATPNIARWNGTKWMALGAGLAYAVRAISVATDGTLYATSCRQRPREPDLGNGVMKWDGMSWTRLQGTPDCVFQLAAGSEGEVFAGWSTGTHRWDPEEESWHHVPGVPAGYGSTLITTDSDGILYGIARGPTGDLLMRADEGAWQVLESDPGPRVRTLHIGADGNVYIVTSENLPNTTFPDEIRRWQDGEWILVEDHLIGHVRQLSVMADGTLYAGGRFSREADEQLSNLARLAAGQWSSPIRRGNGGDGRIMHAVRGQDGEVYVAGDFTRLGESTSPRVARWDGQRWWSMADPDGGILGMGLGADMVVHVSGWFGGGGPATATHNVQAWLEEAWKALPPLYCRNDPSSELATVRTVASDQSGTLHVGGRCTITDSSPIYNVGFVARLEGGTWDWLAELETSPQGGETYVRRIVFSDDGHLFAGGTFNRVGDVEANNVARWDGAAWHPLGGGTSRSDGHAGEVFALLWHDGRLYAGGTFDKADDQTARFVASWDGQRWSSLGFGFNAAVFTLAIGPDGALYAGGNYVWADEEEAFGIARWNGTAWQSMSGGVHDWTGRNVLALAVDAQDRLLVGGQFERAGDVVAQSVVRWVAEGAGQPPVGPPEPIFALAVYPNPARAMVRVDLELDVDAPVRIALYDLTGRRVRVVHDGLLAADEVHRFAVPTSGVAAGLYVVSVSAQGARAQHRVVIVP